MSRRTTNDELAALTGRHDGALWEEMLAGFAERLKESERSWCGKRRPKRLIPWSQLFLPHHFSFPPSAMHRWAEKKLDEAVRRRGTKINLLAPRGSAKSTLGTLAYPLREALEGREPYIWIISDTKSQAQTHLENIKRELLDNRRLRECYPAAEKSSMKSNAVVLGNGAVLESYGTGQRIRGRRLRQFRPTLIVCDDIQNDDHIVSEVRRSRSRTWFHGTLLKAGTVTTNVVHLATALHQEAIAMELLKNPGWTSRVFKAVLRWPDNTPLWQKWERIVSNLENENARGDALDFYRRHESEMNEGAQILWPENESLYDLMMMKLEGGEKTFLREKQNSPINPDFCEFDEASFGEEIWFDERPKAVELKTLALDPSKGKDAKSGDYSALVLCAAADDGTLYIDAEIARLPVHELLDTAVELYRRWTPDLFGVEINQFQELLKDELARRFVAAGLYGVEPYPIRNSVNKAVRVRRLGPLLAARRIRFRRNSPGTRLLVEQLQSFPVGDHDDGPDALEMAVRLVELIRRAPEAPDTLGDSFPFAPD